MTWATIDSSRTGKAHCWYDPKNTSSPSIRVSYCGRITRAEHLQQRGEEIGHCLTCKKRRVLAALDSM